MKRILSYIALATLVATSAAVPAGAAEGIVISGPRIELGEIGSAPESLRALDVGPAPPPGGSVALDRDHVMSLVRAAGGDPQTVLLPRVLRVTSASRKWSPAEVTAFVTPAIQNALPKGVTLTQVEAKIPLLAAPDAQVGRAEIPKAPKKAGLFRTGVIVPIIAGGTVVQRVAVTATFDVSDAAARPDVLRGSRVTLVIDRRSARIGASGVAMADTDVGAVAEFRVEKTGRVVRARLEGTDLASVVFP
jgi:hypothetical protein